MSIQIMQANALDLPLADESVDLVVTSPPYFGLRSYQDGGEHYDGQLGDEPTPAEFVDALIAATAEMMRVLKPSGSIWVNLGDKYAQNAGQWQGSRRGHRGALKGTKADRASQWGQGAWNEAPEMGRPKSLIGIPWRYAIRCIDDLGLILRAEIIWSKPNGLPESVTDRVRRSHETWFHFVKQPRYFSAVDEIREPHAPASLARYAKPFNESNHNSGRRDQSGNVDYPDGLVQANPLGKLPGSVWTIATQPLIVPAELGIDHFAAFPMEWPRRIIQGWSPSGVCVACGEGRNKNGCACNALVGSPVGQRVALDDSLTTGRGGFNRPRGKSEGKRFITRAQQAYDAQTIRQSPHREQMAIEAGEAFAHYIRTDASGARPVPPALRDKWLERGWLTDISPSELPATRPAVVLDPFGGTGTTALVADVLGRDAISVDLSADYCRLARWRTTDPGERARAAQRPKPKPTPVHPEQGTLI